MKIAMVGSGYGATLRTEQNCSVRISDAAVGAVRTTGVAMATTKPASQPSTQTATAFTATGGWRSRRSRS